MASALPVTGPTAGPASDGLALKAHKPGFSPSDVHVLLVDDERLSRTVVSNLLRRCNYTGTLSRFTFSACMLIASHFLR